MAVVVIVLLAVVALGLLAAAVRIYPQYERGVQFRLGKLKDGPRGPGLVLVIPLVDRMRRVSLRIVTMPIPSQEIITRDNVSVDISGVAYYRIADPAVHQLCDLVCGNIARRFEDVASTRAAFARTARAKPTTGR